MQFYELTKLFSLFLRNRDSVVGILLPRNEKKQAMKPASSY